MVTNEGTNVTVEWSAQGDATVYKVYRYVVQEDGTYKLDTFGKKVEDVRTFIDTYGVKENTEYLYVVVPLVNNYYDVSKARGGLITIEASDNEKPETVVETVSNVQAVQNGKNVELSWDVFVSDGKEIDRYRVQRFKLDANGNWVKDGSARNASGTSYVDNKAQVGVQYKYQIIPRTSFYDESKAGTVEITLSE